MSRRVGTREAAPIIGRSARTLEAWREKGIGPPYVKLPTGGVVYDSSELESWLRGLRHDPNNAPSTASERS